MNKSKTIKNPVNTKIIKTATNPTLVKNVQTKQSLNTTKKPNSTTAGSEGKKANEPIKESFASNQIIDSINKFSLSFYLNLKYFSNIDDFIISPLSVYYILHLFFSCSQEDDQLYVELEKVLGIKKEEKVKPLYEIIKKVFTDNFTMINKTHSIENYLAVKFKQTIKSDYNSSLIEDSNKLKELTRNDSKVLMILLNDLNFDFEINYVKCLFSYKPLGLPLKLYEYPFNDENFVLNLVFCEENNIDDKLFHDLTYFNDIINELKPIKSLDNPKIQVPKIQIQNDQSTFVNNLMLLGVKSLNNSEDIQRYGLNVNEANFTSLIQVESNRIIAKSQTRFDLKRDIDCDKILNNNDSNGKTTLNSVIVLIRNKTENLILFMGKYSK
jgi:hypothetical protein